MSTGDANRDGIAGSLEVAQRIELIRFAYRLILRFEVDEAGLNHWMNALAGGLPFEDFLGVLNGAASPIDVPPILARTRHKILDGLRLSGTNPEEDFSQIEQAIRNSAAGSALAIRLRPT